jgi:hypothetical protein
MRPRFDALIGDVPPEAAAHLMVVRGLFFTSPAQDPSPQLAMASS